MQHIKTHNITMSRKHHSGVSLRSSRSALKKTNSLTPRSSTLSSHNWTTRRFIQNNSLVDPRHGYIPPSLHVTFRNDELRLPPMVSDAPEKELHVKLHMQYSHRMRILAYKQKFEEAEEVFHSISHQLLKPNALTYNSMIYTLHLQQKSEEIEELIKQMKEQGLQTTHQTYFPLIVAYGKQRAFKKAVDVIPRMKEDHLVPGIRTFERIFEALSQASSDQIFWVFNVQMKQESVVPNNFIFQKVLKTFSDRGLYSEFKKVRKLMNEMGVLPNTGTLKVLMEGYEKAGDTKNVYLIKQEMKHRVLKPDQSSHEILVRAHAKDGDLSSMFQAFSNALSFGKPDKSLYEVMLAACAKKGDVAQMEYCVELMSSLPEFCPVDVNYCTYLIRGYSKGGDFSKAMQSYELAKNKMIPLGEIDFRRLIYCCGLSKQDQSIPKLIEEAKTQFQVKPSTQLYNTAIESALKCENLLLAVKLLLELPKEEVDYDVVVLRQVLSKLSHTIPPKVIQRSPITTLNLLLSKKPDEQTPLTKQELEYTDLVLNTALKYLAELPSQSK